MKIFIFDIDDTLYDLRQPFEIAFKSMFGFLHEDIYNIFLDFRKYNNKIYDKALIGEISMEELCIYRAKMAFKDHGIDIEDSDAIRFQLEYMEGKKHIELDKDVRKTLEFLKEKNLPMGIITNGPHREQFQKVGYLGVDKYISFENIVVSEDVGFYKPDVRIFNLAKEKILNSITQSIYNKNVDIFYIGDSFENDIIGAKSAKMKTIWINRRGYYSDGHISSDYEVNSFEDLYKLILEICNQTY